MLTSDKYPSGIVPITPGTTQLGLCGIIASAAGTASIVDTHGNPATLTLAAGIPVYLGITQVTAASVTVLGFIP